MKRKVLEKIIREEIALVSETFKKGDRVKFVGEKSIFKKLDPNRIYTVDDVVPHKDGGEQYIVDQNPMSADDLQLAESVNEAAAPKFTAKEFVAYVNDEFDSETIQLMQNVLAERLRFLDKMKGMADPRTVVQGYMRKNDLKESLGRYDLKLEEHLSDNWSPDYLELTEENIGTEVVSIINEIATNHGYSGETQSSKTVSGVVKKLIPNIPKAQRKGFISHVTDVKGLFSVDEITL